MVCVGMAEHVVLVDVLVFAVTPIVQPRNREVNAVGLRVSRPDANNPEQAMCHGHFAQRVAMKSSMDPSRPECGAPWASERETWMRELASGCHICSVVDRPKSKHAISVTPPEPSDGIWPLYTTGGHENLSGSKHARAWPEGCQ